MEDILPCVLENNIIWPAWRDFNILIAFFVYGNMPKNIPVLCSNGSLSATECLVSLNLMSFIVTYRVRLVLFCLENQTNGEKSDVIIPFYSATHSVRCSRMFGISWAYFDIGLAGQYIDFLKVLWFPFPVRPFSRSLCRRKPKIFLARASRSRKSLSSTCG